MKTIQDLKDWLYANGYHAGLGDIIRMEQDEKYAKKVKFATFYIPGAENTLADVLMDYFTWGDTDLNSYYWSRIHRKLKPDDL